MKRLCLLLMACADGAEGTSIGNPNLTVLRIAPAGDGIAVSTAEVGIGAIRITDLAGETTVYDAPEGRNLLSGVDFELPTGTWASLQLELNGDFMLSGDDAGDRIDLQLELNAVGVAASRSPLEINQPHVFELAYPDWLTATEVGWTPGQAHVVRPGDQLHDTLATVVAQRSSLLPDGDGDGEPDR